MSVSVAPILSAQSKYTPTGGSKMRDEKDEPGEQVHSEPAVQPKRRIPAWFLFIVAFVVINSASLVIDHLLNEESRKRLRLADNSFVSSVKAVDPFQMARSYWNYVWYDISPELQNASPPLDPNGRPWVPRKAPEPSFSEKAGSTYRRMIFGWVWVIVFAFTTGGPLGGIITLLAFGLAYMIISDMGDREVKIFDIVLIPLIGWPLVWILIFVMQAAGFLFGRVLDIAGILAATNATAFGLFWKVGEHRVTDSIIKGFSGLFWNAGEHRVTDSRNKPTHPS
jgi:hypothetical protein